MPRVEIVVRMDITDRFTRLQLDVFQALADFYIPRRADPPRQQVREQRGPRSRREAFRLFPVVILIAKHLRGRELRG